MRRVRPVVLFFIAIFLTGFYFGPSVLASLLDPGSDNDPLVTKAWVDRYINITFSPFDGKIQALKESTDNLQSSVRVAEALISREIKLTIGVQTALVGLQPRPLDVAPALISGRTMLPLRFIGEALGAEFSWDAPTKKVTYVYQGTTVELTVGKKTAFINGQQVELDVPPVVQNNRTLVPLRFIGESLGAQVTWFGETKTVVVRLR